MPVPNEPEGWQLNDEIHCCPQNNSKCHPSYSEVLREKQNTSNNSKVVKKRPKGTEKECFKAILNADQDGCDGKQDWRKKQYTHQFDSQF